MAITYGKNMLKKVVLKKKKKSDINSERLEKALTYMKDNLIDS